MTSHLSETQVRELREIAASGRELRPDSDEIVALCDSWLALKKSVKTIVKEDGVVVSRQAKRIKELEREQEQLQAANKELTHAVVMARLRAQETSDLMGTALTVATNRRHLVSLVCESCGHDIWDEIGPDTTVCERCGKEWKGVWAAT